MPPHSKLHTAKLFSLFINFIIALPGLLLAQDTQEEMEDALDANRVEDIAKFQ